MNRFHTMRVSDGFLIQIFVAHNNEPQMGNRVRNSETLRVHYYFMHL